MLGSCACSHKDGNKPLPPTVQTKNLLQQGKQNKQTHTHERTRAVFHGFPHFLPCAASLSRAQCAVTLVASDPARHYLGKRGSGCASRVRRLRHKVAVARSVEGRLQCAFPADDKF